MSETINEQVIREENLSEGATFGDGNQLYSSQIQGDVSLGENSSLNHCYIDGTVTLNGSYSTILGNVIHSSSENGISIDATGFTGGFDSTRNIKTKFTDEVIEKAWKLLEEYMTPPQYFAFIEGSKIELENKTGEFRLIVDKKGNFSILEGKRGEGIMATSGRIRSYDYPLGDEIATFMDWFRFKTKELISQWNCGTYGIVKEGQRR